MTGKELAQVLNKFLTSPNAQSARVQIEMPNGEKLDVSEIQLLENRMIGDRDQIAFFVRHPKNSFVLVAGSPDPELVRLYPGSRILELVDDGLRLEPLACGLAACVAWFESLGA
jgi:hypothetical protein